jgi:CheY-like chemotaxis protein
MRQACRKIASDFQQVLSISSHAVGEMPKQETMMKAMILRDNAAEAVATANLLARKGFQTCCVGSRDIAQAMIRAEVIDLVVMDERVGAQLTHTLALSAERRNPYVSTIIMTDQGAEETDDLYALIPSLYALVGTRMAPDLFGQIVLSAVANADEVARRIDRALALEAAEEAEEVAMPPFDLLADEEDEGGPDDLPAMVAPMRNWGDLNRMAPQAVITPIDPPGRAYA